MNDENLKGYGFHERTAREQREIAVMGGQASGESRRRSASFRKTLNLLLTAKIDNEEYKPLLEALGLECTLEAALNMAMIKKGLAGDVKAYEAIAKYAGQSSITAADEEEQRIRTDRAKSARDQEVGDVDNENENIKSFLKAMNPDQSDIDQLFAEEESVEEDEETEETGEV